MNYTESVCVAASDAAGAAVVGASTSTTAFRLADWENETQSKYYGALRMKSRPVTINGLDAQGVVDPPGNPVPPPIVTPPLRRSTTRGAGRR